MWGLILINYFQRSRFDDREDCSEELGEMVTVDTVGFEDDDVSL